MDVVDPVSPAGVPTLAGHAVGVTAARRAEELATMLERRGASVLRGRSLEIVALAADDELHAVTRDLIARPPDVTVATTDTGVHGWVDAAFGWTVGDELVSALGGGVLVARGPKARAALEACGLAGAWSPPADSPDDLLAHLLHREPAGRRIAVQLHGRPLPGLVDGLRAAGAEVVEVPVYRWQQPADPAPLDRLVDAVLERQLGAVAFTSAPAASGFLARSDQRGMLPDVVAALRTSTVAACVGPVAAAPLREVGVPTSEPPRPRLGALVATLEAELVDRTRTLLVAGRRLDIRGQAVVLDGVLRRLPPVAMTLLHELARCPGRVVLRRQLRAALPRGGDDHALDAAVARLRTALGDPALVETVVKRGHRLTAGDAGVASPVA